MWLGISFRGGEHMMPGKIKRLMLLHSLGFKPSVSARWLDSRVSFAVSYQKDYRCRMIHPDHLIAELRRTISQEHPDVIVTQLEQSESVIKEAHSSHIPSVMFLTDCEKLSLSRITGSGNQKPAGIICVSDFVKSRVSGLTDVPVQVFYPPIHPSDYLVRESTVRPYITCINPIRLKGGDVLEEIIRNLPKERFLIVKGWYDPTEDGLDFRKYPNVLIMEKQFDMRGIYGSTKILLVPSLWDEPIPRVIMEAGVNGIPIIASKRGGVPEALGEGGILINNPLDIQTWISAITKLNTDISRYRQVSTAIKEQTKRFTIEKIGPRFEQWTHSLICTYSQQHGRSQ